MRPVEDNPGRPGPPRRTLVSWAGASRRPHWRCSDTPFAPACGGCVHESLGGIQRLFRIGREVRIGWAVRAAPIHGPARRPLIPVTVVQPHTACTAFENPCCLSIGIQRGASSSVHGADDAPSRASARSETSRRRPGGAGRPAPPVRLMSTQPDSSRSIPVSFRYSPARRMPASGWSPLSLAWIAMSSLLTVRDILLRGLDW